MTKRAALLALALCLAACAGPEGTAYERGVAAFESGDIRTARVELLNALQLNPNDKAARVSGEYFYHLQKRAPNPDARDKALQDGLIDACRKLSGVALPD